MHMWRKMSCNKKKLSFLVLDSVEGAVLMIGENIISKINAHLSKVPKRHAFDKNPMVMIERIVPGCYLYTII